jgi:hypothetical protein
MIFEFEDCANYRGCLQVTTKDGKYYWRVYCDVESEASLEESWIEIPESLYLELLAYHTDKSRQSKTYTLWLHPSVVVRVASDDPFAPSIRAQEALVAHLRALKLDDLVVVSASCDRVWPHGCDDLPLTANPRTTRP